MPSVRPEEWIRVGRRIVRHGQTVEKPSVHLSASSKRTENASKTLKILRSY